MPDSLITNKSTLFPEQLVAELYSKVAGRSSLAKLSGASPMPFNGIKTFVFSMENEASLVGEGEAKPAGDAKLTPVVIVPHKFIYQHRLSDEFMHASEEVQLDYLKAFSDGFAKKIARALDIAAMHGLNPRTSTAASALADYNFDSKIQNLVVYDSTAPDENIDSAIAALTALDCQATGMALSPAFGAAMAKVKVNGVVQYPEFRFGQIPNSFAGFGIDINNTVTVKASGATRTDHGIVGNFRDCFRWGYAKDIPLEVIEYGDPDGQGRDLKQYNEVCLRTEAYLGFGILDPDAFAIIYHQNSQNSQSS